MCTKTEIAEIPGRMARTKKERSVLVVQPLRSDLGHVDAANIAYKYKAHGEYSMAKTVNPLAPKDLNKQDSPSKREENVVCRRDDGGMKAG